jgi:hypothetical protein
VGPQARSPAASPPALPEVARVYWRRRVDRASLVRRGRIWTLCTCAHTVPFIGSAAALAILKPITLPVGLILVAHAWIIPELYAARGANVVRTRPSLDHAAERLALGLLGDLLDHDARDLHARTGLVLERGVLGVWVLAQAGALLIAPGGRRVHCYCVNVPGDALPGADRIAHLLLALRCDEAGFATVANHAFAGAPWRLRRRMPHQARPALRRAREIARSRGVTGHAVNKPCRGS